MVLQNKIQISSFDNDAALSNELVSSPFLFLTAVILLWQLLSRCRNIRCFYGRDLDRFRAISEHSADHQPSNVFHQLGKHFRCSTFILYQWVTLGVSLKTDGNSQRFDAR